MPSMGQDQLHIFFFPFMAHGHIIPTIDMAKLFASRGVKSTVITTPLNAKTISKTIQRTKNSGFDIDIRILEFPAEAGLPEGCENMDVIISHQDGKDLVMKFFRAIARLQQPLENLLGECKPDCLVADMFFPWTTDAAAKFGIPRLVFHGINFFSLCTGECIKLYEPHKKVSSDSEPFVIPYLPGEIKYTRKQLPDFLRQQEENDFLKMVKAVKESELKSYGVIVNSFYELESVYADFYRKELGRRAWHIGPLSLCNSGIEDKTQRGREATIDEHECTKWLDSKKPNSIIYICFGSLANFTASQLMELAVGLEASGQQFIWVVRRNKKSQEEDDEEWLPKGFEERMEGKGMIIRGWAPQVLILDHEAIGGFVTHCGWNSTLEGITAGKPMVTWPISAEQFYNEKLVTEILKIGTGVGVKEWVKFHGDHVTSEAVEKAINRIMTGEEAEEMRSRAKKLAEMAGHAVEEGGSSYSDLNALVEELRPRRGYQMDSDAKRHPELYFFFFPFMAQGHSIPLIDMAKLFASRGQKVSIITTPVNAPDISKAIERSRVLGHEIDILIIKFPCVEAGLPEGCEHLELVTSPEMGLNFFMATDILAKPLEHLLKQYRPDCLVADTFFPWSNEAASKSGIPRIVFSGTCFFSSCASQCVNKYQPYKNISSDTDLFVIPEFPGEIKLTRNQLPEFVIQQTGFSEFYQKVKEAEAKCYGVIVNSFYELEPDYVDNFKKVLGIKAWNIGPISLCNSNIQDKAKRGREASIDENECLGWLNSKKPNSVIYICFGSVANFLSSQLLEIAMGLEDSGQQFIWVVKKSKNNQEEWLPEGFEKRMEGKGLIIHGWAPQVTILEHEAIGGFVTHCGWNSTLEAIAAGVPMVTWPVAAEQFYNEKLITEILRIGVAVGTKKWSRVVGDSVKKEAIKKAVTQVMVDKEAEEMRCRAKNIGEMARKAVSEGGSSYSDFNAFIEELRRKKFLQDQMESGKRSELYFFFFPFMAQGHSIPLIDMAKLFASRGQKVSIITTPVNAPDISKSIQRSRVLGHKIDIVIIKFPCVEAGLPEGCEHLELVTSPEMVSVFFQATTILAQPLEHLLKKYCPDCLVSDTFFPWSNKVASKFGIPRIVFSGTCFFSSCASQCMYLYQPCKNVSSDTDVFVIPNLPREIKLTRNQLPEFVKEETSFSDYYRKVKEAEAKSYGVLVNSFYELEPTYADHYRNVLGIKAWHIGPISLCNSNNQDMLNRGKEASIDENECLEWLNSKKPNSVVYICFGSLANFVSSQLLEIAMGLEDSGQQFIWVVKKSKSNEEDWLPDGFEERMKEKGLIIRGWAPQVMILEHKAVGGFVTHCGWNSTLEAVSAGVPMVTWPVSAEQFYNEKLITEVLRIGVAVGAQKWLKLEGDGVKKEAINKAVTQVMVGGKEAEEMRCRAEKLGEMAKKAVAEGGSSHSDFNTLIEGLRSKN
ncbi:uncharacterized protein LOC8288161 [Ricinus communis]|nr:uncharacterized protein LOC8288161 [Ricinus communis]